MADNLTISADIIDGTNITSDVTGGVSVTTNVTESTTVTANVISGGKGDKGDPGDDGANGQGVPTGGTSGQLLAKSSSTDYDTHWIDSSSGSGITRVVTVTSGNTNAGSTASTDYIYLVAGAHTVTLPTAVGNTNRYAVKNNHSAAITVNTTSSQTIDGTTSIQISPEDSVDIISDNSNWRII